MTLCCDLCMLISCAYSCSATGDLCTYLHTYIHACTYTYIHTSYSKNAIGVKKSFQKKGRFAHIGNEIKICRENKCHHHCGRFGYNAYLERFPLGLEVNLSLESWRIKSVDECIPTTCIDSRSACDCLNVNLELLSHSVRSGMDRLNPPEPLQLKDSVAENFKKFKQSFKIFQVASGLESKAKKIQSMTLLRVVGSDALEIYNTSDGQKVTVQVSVRRICTRLNAF